MNIKKMVLLGVCTFSLFSCSSTSKQSTDNSNRDDPDKSTIAPINDQRLAESEFKSKGVKIYYTLFGDVEAIEATGYAAVWGNSPNAARESYRVAELEAKKSLSDFINQETISSTTSVRMISANLERAQDKTQNTLVAIDSSLPNTPKQENTAIRNNSLKIASKLQTTITTQNKGILGGLYLKESGVIDGGRSVRVVMRWDKKHNDSRKQIRNLMAQ